MQKYQKFTRDKNVKFLCIFEGVIMEKLKGGVITFPWCKPKPHGKKERRASALDPMGTGPPKYPALTSSGRKACWTSAA